MQRFVISIDVGGTFTDCVVIGEDGRTAAAKVRSTPADNFRSGFANSIGAAAELGRDSGQALEQAIRISHGSTVATNIMVQGGSGGTIAYTPHKGDVALALATVYGIPKTHGLPGGHPGTRCETHIARDTDERAQFAGGTAPEGLEAVGGSIEVADDVRHGCVSEGMVRETYRVVLAADGVVDEGATEDRRREVRAGRMERASAPGEAGGDGSRGRDGASAGGRIGDRISIEAGRARCAACRHDLGRSDANLKDHLAVEESPLSDAGPLFADPASYVDDERIRLHRFACPGCAAQLSVAVEHTGEEALSEFEIRA